MGSRERDAAERLLESGQHHEAVERFRALIAQTPDDPALRGRLAEAYRQAGNVDRAFHHYDQAARTLSAMGMDGLAADFLERCDELVPQQPEIIFRRAKALERLERGDELERVCERLVEAARASGDRRRSWALERLHARRPDDPDIALARARFLLEAGQSDEAAEVFRSLVAARAGAGLPSEVERELREAARAHPELARPLAEAALAAGDPRAAVAHLVPLHERDPESAPTLRLIVRALEQLGAHDKLRTARIELVKAETRAGKNPEVLPVIGRLLSDAPRDPEAVEVAAHALMVLERGAEAAKLWARLVELHHVGNRSVDRDRAILQLLRAAPEDASALRAAARVLRATGRDAEADALDARIRALDAPPAPPEAVPRPAPSPPSSGAVPRPSASAAPARGGYGRGLSWGQPRSPAASPSPSDTLEDALAEREAAHDTDDMDPEASADAAASALERAVAHVGEGAPSPGPRTAFERRYPSGASGGPPPDLLPEE